MVDGIWIIANIDGQPNGTGQSENIHKEDGTHGNQGGEGNFGAPTEAPVESQHKSYTKKAGEDIGDKHGAVVKTGFRPVIQPAISTPFGHIKGLGIGEGRGFEQVSFVAAGAP